MCAHSQHHVRLFATPRSIAHQDSLTMGFPRQEYWSGLPFPSPGGLPLPETELASLVSSALADSLPEWKPIRMSLNTTIICADVPITRFAI